LYERYSKHSLLNIILDLSVHVPMGLDPVLCHQVLGGGLCSDLIPTRGNEGVLVVEAVLNFFSHPFVKNGGSKKIWPHFDFFFESCFLA
jgi:hypothetical protein